MPLLVPMSREYWLDWGLAHMWVGGCVGLENQEKGQEVGEGRGRLDVHRQMSKVLLS